ncbi:MAG TPA: DISARM system SNF2-like helicase DrmD [Herpetosiphonaceae bacterium]
MAGTSPPQQGQLVHVRQRRYVVTEVRQSALPPDLATPLATPQHLVSLASVEDDATGEELQVLWEIEPGARVVEHAALPEVAGFDPPERFDAFLDAVRWGTVASANLRALQAPFRAGIELEDYQLDPVVRAIQMPRANLLIADDVGLGKTVETGLVVQELMLRHRARTVLVVCPAALQIQWREQLRDKFGLAFRIVDAALMKTLRRERGLHVNPWTHYPLLITSIDFLKRDRPMRLFSEALPASGEPTYPRRFDLLIIDEVHNVAPSGRGHYAIDSLRTQAVRRIAPHFEHRLFLSATPHNGYPESFTALLELLDHQRFARGVAPDREQLQAIMVRRLKSELVDWGGKPRFPARQLEALEVDYAPAEREAHRLLRDYATLRQRAARDQTEHVAAEFVLKLLKKRLFSSPEAFARTLERHEESLASARRRSPVAKPAVGILRQQIEQAEAFNDDETAEEATDDAMSAASRLFAELSAEERLLLDQLRGWAGVARGRPDSRTRLLIDWLRRQLQPDGAWNSERVILFTEYRDTQRWLLDMLTAAGLGDQGRLMTLYGGMDPDQRERVKAAFQAAPDLSPVRILLATDAASEGIDLQNHCARLIHFEIPWNPSRLEQRNGRVDRHGQKAPAVHIYHFVSSGWQTGQAATPGELEADLEFLFRAAQKVNTIREDLGKVGPVIASQVEEAMLGRRARLDTAEAERSSVPIQRLLKMEHKLRDQLKAFNEQLRETRSELQLSPERVQRAVEIGLELAGQPPLRRAAQEPVFQVPALSGSWASSTDGLAHPHTGALRPIVFDHARAKGRDDVVLAHLNHRLVQMALRLLRAEVWAEGGQRRIQRVTARTVADEALAAPAVIAHARLVVLGGDQQRLHEELVAAGGVIREGRFARLNVGEVQQALAAARPTPLPPHIQERLIELWPRQIEPLRQALEARVRERSASLQKLLADRAAKEARDLSTILSELRATILDELRAGTGAQQLSLFSDPERDQFQRNMDSLRRRAEAIPAEIELETAAIAARYADPQPRYFPVAVTFLMPERLAR